MAEALQAASGGHVALGARIAGGGEGDIHRVPDRPGLCAKVYHPAARTPERRAKLEAMLRHPPRQPNATLGHRSLAWPQELLLEAGGGRVAGFLMPLLPDGSRPALEYLQPEDRVRAHPGFHFRYLLAAARNAAAAFAAVHEAGCCVGDVNESNTMITDTALVTLIDCDSFQVPGPGGRALRCPVGKPEYTAPELVGRPFPDADRTAESDAFGLAVLIFQLLMQGFHPFAGRWAGAGEPPDLGRRVREGLYAYGGSGQGPLVPPPAAPPLSVLPRAVRAAFAQAFGPGIGDPRSRPPAAAWVGVLDGAARRLVACRARGDQHRYPRGLRGCPWCACARRGQDFFPAVVGAQVPLPPPAPGPGPRTAEPGEALAGAPRPAVRRAGRAPAAGPSPRGVPGPGGAPPAPAGGKGAGPRPSGAGSSAAGASAAPAGTPPAVPALLRGLGGWRASRAGPALPAAPGPSASARGGPRLVLEPRELAVPAVVRGGFPRSLTLLVRNIGGERFRGPVALSPGGGEVRIAPAEVDLPPGGAGGAARLAVRVDPGAVQWGRRYVRTVRVGDASALIVVSAAGEDVAAAAARRYAAAGGWAAPLLAALTSAARGAAAGGRGWGPAAEGVRRLWAAAFAPGAPLRGGGLAVWAAAAAACVLASRVWRLRGHARAWRPLLRDGRWHWRPAAAAALVLAWLPVALLLDRRFLDAAPAGGRLGWAAGVLLVPAAWLAARGLALGAAGPLRDVVRRRGAGIGTALGVAAATAGTALVVAAAGLTVAGFLPRALGRAPASAGPVAAAAAAGGSRAGPAPVPPGGAG